MSVNTDYSRYSVSSTKTADTGKTAAKTTKAASEDVKTDTSAKRTDTFERSESSKGVVTDYKSKTTLGMKNEAMKDVVAKLIGGQAAHASGKTDTNSMLDKLLQSYGVEPIKSDGSDDFWGAEKTANRILDFAKSLIGDDKDAFDKIKGAFEKAFGECENVWGGKLPSVCYDTLDKVRQGFDDYEKEKFSAAAEE